MSVLEAIIQGIVQGATEFLPVSSSGHLSLAKHILGVQVDSLLFDVMLHLGTLIAVLIVYRKLVWRLLLALFSLFRDVFTGKFRWKEMDDDRRLLLMLFIGLLPLFLLFVPIPGTEMKIKDLSDLLATDASILAEGFALMATGILLFLGIRANKKVKLTRRTRDHDGKRLHSTGRKKYHTADAVCVGLGQVCAAVFPGLSRSGTTLSVGLMRGINQQTALDFSFVLGIPSICAAALLTVKDAIDAKEAFDALPMLAGVITAAIVGFLAIKLLKWIVKTDKLKIFAFYALILGIVVVFVGLLEAYTGINIFTGVSLK